MKMSKEELQALAKELQTVSGPWVEEITCAYIKDEYRRAIAKFPDSKYNLTALGEEVGELQKAILQFECEPEKGITEEDIVMEAIQVGAMALKIILHGDSSFPKFKGLLNMEVSNVKWG